MFALSLLAILLVGCSNGDQRLLGESAPQSGKQTATANPLVVPPKETFAPAGPGAENELDYETLEGPGMIDPEALPEMATPEAEVAEDVAPQPPAKPKPPKPGDVVINAVAVTGVEGSPGAGNKELATAMREILKEAGWPVLNTARKDALTIKGRVELGQVHEGRQMVRLTWFVLEPDGKKLGDLKQENIVPAGSLDAGWGENATLASEAAAEGIYKIIKPMM